MGIPLRVLLVEDSEDDAFLAVRELERGGFDPAWNRVDDAAAMEEALRRQEWDVILSDHRMPTFSSFQALEVLRHSGLDVPFIIVSGSIGEDLAVDAMRAGAQDYLLKQNLKRLGPAVERELKEVTVRRARREAEETVRHLAFYDRLTGLQSRPRIEEVINQAIEDGRRDNKTVAVAVIGLDRFLEIESSLGHHNGEVVLKEAARRFTDALLPGETVGRISDTGFAVVLPGADVEHATRTARRLLRAMENSVAVEGLEIDVGASCGIAMHPGHGDDPATLLQRAGVAMEDARRRAEGVALYAAERDPHKSDRLVLLGELRRAIDEGQLRVYYQPKVDIAKGRTIGFEALVRWHHPNRGVIPPDDFIPAAEHSGLVKPLTRFVLNEALRQCHGWRRDGMPVQIAVNLAVRNLLDPNLREMVSGLLETWGIPASSLELEITESAIMTDPRAAMQVLEQLHGSGIPLSLDDFGTGYSSMAYLRKLPVSELKIDKSFVFGMAKNENDAMIVRCIIDLAHNLGLRVVAEGVENQEIWDRLAALGCDVAQGYLMGKPMPAEEATRWLQESPWGLRSPSVSSPARA